MDRTPVGGVLLLLALALTTACQSESTPATASGGSAGGTAAGGAGGGTAEPRTLIVDTDMGLDDARVVLALPMQSQFHVVAVVTVEGSASAVKGADNALALLEAVGASGIPVAVGAEQAMTGPVPAPSWRAMAESLGGADVPPAQTVPVGQPGAELLAELLTTSSEPVTVMALGPLTNLAQVLAGDPALAAKVEALYLLGDFVACDSYNCTTDVDAAELVLGTAIPTTMLVSAATDAAPFDAALLEQVTALSGPGAAIIAQMMASHASGVMKLWDDSVLAAMLDEQLVSYEPVSDTLRQGVSLDVGGVQALLLTLWDQPMPQMP